MNGPMQSVSEKFRSSAVELLLNFESELKKSDLREKVRSLIPVFKKLRDLGKSLISSDLEIKAQNRILQYFQKYPFKAIEGNEILVISGIQDWPRRIRELRVQLGWPIVDGFSAKEMASEGEFSIPELDLSKLKTTEYILIDKKNDKEAAFRWHLGNSIRKEKTSVPNKLLEYFRKNVGKEIPGTELRYVANNKSEWARRIRELRSEQGWPIVTKTSGKPDMTSGFYMLIADRQSPEHDRKIPDLTRSKVLRRDGYECKKCGWSQKEWNASDPRHLELHHIQPHGEKGSNEEDNLRTLCTVCHDSAHRKSR